MSEFYGTCVNSKGNDGILWKMIEFCRLVKPSVITIVCLIAAGKLMESKRNRKGAKSHKVNPATKVCDRCLWAQN